MDTIYCLVPRAYWEQFADRDEYVSRDYDKEGFIHATKGDELLEKVANRVYPSLAEELLLLVVDEAKVASPVKYEQASDGLFYPHIYGPLHKKEIREIKRMEQLESSWKIGGTFA